MRIQVRAALVLLAVFVLTFGVWFGIREPSYARVTVLYTDEPVGFGIHDQLPLRIGVAMTCSAVATALLLFAAGRRS